MSDTENNSKSSTDSAEEMDPTVPFPEPQQGTSLQKSSEDSAIPSLPQLKVEGGPITQIAKSVSNVVSKQLTPKAKLATLQFMEAHSRGIAGAAAIKCKGVRCVLVDICPLTGTDDSYPLNQRCPFLQGLVQVWVNKHLNTMGIEDYTLPEYSYDMDMLYELAGQELIRWMAAQQLANKGTLVEERKIGATISGDELFGEVVSPLIEVIDTQSKIIMKIRDALLGTRKAQIQAGRDAGDSSRKSTELAAKARETVNSRLRTLREGEENVKDADFDIKEE